jgi:hypothetical protein
MTEKYRAALFGGLKTDYWAPEEVGSPSRHAL